MKTVRVIADIITLDDGTVEFLVKIIKPSKILKLKIWASHYIKQMMTTTKKYRDDLKLWESKIKIGWFAYYRYQVNTFDKNIAQDFYRLIQL
jgi:hypothetical protein